jgi:hypothetical protein
MRKLFLTACLAILFTGVDAQYKKAGFFNKTGRFYDVGASYRVLGEGRKGATALFLSFGKESSAKRIHHWYDMEVVLPGNFSYDSPANDGSGITYRVSGNTAIGFTLRYNFAYYLADNSSEEASFLPFLHAGLGYTRTAINEEDYSVSPGGYPPKTPSSADPDFMFGMGAGFVYKFTPKIGLRVSGMYNLTLGNYTQDKEQYFITLPNHASVSVGVRFMMHSDE